MGKGFLSAYKRCALILVLLFFSLSSVFALAQLTYSTTPTTTLSNSGTFYLVFNIESQVEWSIVSDLVEKDSEDDSRYILPLEGKTKIAHISFKYPNTGLSSFEISWTVLNHEEGTDTIKYYLTADDFDTTFGTVTASTHEDKNSLTVNYNKVGSSTSEISIVSLYANITDNIDDKYPGNYHSNITVVYSGV